MASLKKYSRILPIILVLSTILTVEQNDSEELIGLDFSNLKKGHYILTIRVTDQDDQKISAEAKRNIQIED